MRPDTPRAEGELVAALRAGNDGAFEEVLRTHGGRLMAVARRMLRDEAEAQDAVQDALLSAFRGLDRFDGQSQLGTWLHRIVVNACLMRLRRRRSRPEQSIEDLLPQFHADGHRAAAVPGWSETADVAAERRETREFVRGAIDRLPESYRTVLLLRDIEDLDTAETARLLEVSTAVVKTRLHRARQALRTLLEPRLGGGPA